MAEASIATILLPQNAPLPPGEQLFAYFSEHWPTLEKPRILEPGHDATTFETSDARGFAVVADFPVPILPDVPPEGEASLSERQRVALKQRAHIVVGISSEIQTPLRTALCLTRWASSIAHATDALGVCWGDYEVVTPTPAFHATALVSDEEALPLHLWVDFRFQQNSDGSLLAATYGLAPLGAWEIEATGARIPAADLFNYVSSFGHYILTAGPVIEDGHTFGFSETERILVRHKTRSSEGKKENIYQLVFDQKEEKKTKRKWLWFGRREG